MSQRFDLMNVEDMLDICEDAMTTPTPRTDAITKLIRDAINEPDRERQIALREGAECGIEQLERDLAAAQKELADIKKEAETNQKWAFLEWRQRAQAAEARAEENVRQYKRLFDLVAAWNEAKEYNEENSDSVWGRRDLAKATKALCAAIAEGK